MSVYQIKHSADAFRKIKGSKFFASVVAVDSRESALSIIHQMEEEHKKASHVCWACRIDQNGELLGYSSDAGEPHASAGPPILAAIEGRSLTNVLCAVVRYFGGTKLGIGGLIRAYGGVASEALDRAGKKKHESKSKLMITAAPDDYSDILRVLRKYRVSIQPDFTPENVSVTFSMTAHETEQLRKAIKAIATAELTHIDIL